MVVPGWTFSSDPGKPQTRGEGQAEIEDARVGGQATAEPIRLELHAKEGGFGFRNHKAEPQRRPEPKSGIGPVPAAGCRPRCPIGCLRGGDASCGPVGP